jgi:hypothetical protein
LLQLNWRQCGRDQHWCDFFYVDLPSAWFGGTQGVYIIWHEGTPREVVLIGKGNIGARIASHRKDPQIVAYREKGPMCVTWAIVERPDLDGTERYLVDMIQPILSSNTRDVEPIESNLPSRWMRAKPTSPGSSNLE